VTVRGASEFSRVISAATDGGFWPQDGLLGSQSSSGWLLDNHRGLSL